MDHAREEDDPFFNVDFGEEFKVGFWNSLVTQLYFCRFLLLLWFLFYSFFSSSLLLLSSLSYNCYYYFHYDYFDQYDGRCVLVFFFEKKAFGWLQSRQRVSNSSFCFLMCRLYWCAFTHPHSKSIGITEILYT